MKAKSPKWKIPKNLQQLIDADSPDGDGMWEDDRWDPILLTVMAGTSYGGYRRVCCLGGVRAHLQDSDRGRLGAHSRFLTCFTHDITTIKKGLTLTLREG